MADVPGTDEWLSPGEAVTAAGLRYPKRRNEWRLGRWTAKRAIAAYTRRSNRMSVLAELEVHAADSGEPQLLINGRPVSMTVSISHSAGLAVCVLVPDTIGLGCDLERIEARCEAFVRTYFTAPEQQVIATAPGDERPLLATLLWSAKESALKALHEGLRLDTRSVEVQLQSSGGIWRTLRVLHRDSGQAIDGWWRRCGHYVFTVAALTELRLPVELRPY